MTPDEFEAALQAAFQQCEMAGCPLDPQQKRLLLAALPFNSSGASDLSLTNPLDDLTAEQRQTLLTFVREQEAEGKSWKIQLLNDWLQGQSSGTMQFIRDLYGFGWLERIQPGHLAAYAEDLLVLQVGDRIEVANSLWEWVQDDGPCSREWVTCVIVGITETCDDTPNPSASYLCSTSCTIRFESGTEYEIQGIYEWNRYNWRWQT